MIRKQSLAPGQEHDLKISATVINSDKAIKNVDPEKRNCYFPGENALDLFKVRYDFIFVLKMIKIQSINIRKTRTKFVH